MRRAASLALAAVALLAACTPNTQPDPETTATASGGGATLSITSDAFGDGGLIPAAYTCDGQNVSPPLSWSGVPEDAAELVLIVDDPDAPRGTFVHWVVSGIDAGQTGVGIGSVPSGSVQGRTSFGTTGYGGPCPPEGDAPHTYRFRLWAVASELALSGDATAEQVEAAADADAVATGTLTGRYARG